jgi:hypothetical protein
MQQMINPFLGNSQPHAEQACAAQAQSSQYIHAQNCLPLHLARQWLRTLLQTLMKPELQHPAGLACRKIQRPIM